MDGPSRDFTATTFVVHRQRVFLLWHLKVQAWLPPGGHIHTDELPEEAAVREVREESGLEVELAGAPQTWGQVRVLHTPHCILLEDIQPGHQHIDLIYFARALALPPRLNRSESAAFRWCDYAQLGAPEIAIDIRRLGRRALRALGA